QGHPRQLAEIADEFLRIPWLSRARGIEATQWGLRGTLQLGNEASNAPEQLVSGEWLAQDVVGAHAGGASGDRRIDDIRHENNASRAPAWMRLHELAEAIAIHVRQVDVCDHEGGRLALDLGDSIGPGRGKQDFHPALRQHAVEECSNAWIFVRYQDFRHGLSVASLR